MSRFPASRIRGQIEKTREVKAMASVPRTEITSERVPLSKPRDGRHREADSHKKPATRRERSPVVRRHGNPPRSLDVDAAFLAVLPSSVNAAPVKEAGR